jgi:hypothetical protein
MMMNRFGVSLVILALTTACQSGPEPSPTAAGAEGGAAQVKTASDPAHSGFLPADVYPKLAAAPDREGVMMYVDRSRDYRPYSKLLFDPTEVYLVPNPAYQGMPRDALARMTADFQHSFEIAVSPGYQVVHQPGPDVLRVRTAITGVQPAPPPVGVTDFLPIKAAFNVARKAAGAAPQVAEMSAELLVLDPDGTVVGAGTATRKGDQHLAQGDQITWPEMQSISEYWAKSFRQRLDELRGVSPPQ